MGKVKDFFEFIKFLEKEEGYKQSNKVEKGFYFRTMGESILFAAVGLLVLLVLILKIISN